jgi:hypothetical protein
MVRLLKTLAADHQRIAKLDRDDDPKPPEKVDMSCVSKIFLRYID